MLLLSHQYPHPGDASWSIQLYFPFSHVVTCTFCRAICRLRMSISCCASMSFLMDRSIPSSSKSVSPNWISGSDLERCQKSQILHGCTADDYTLNNVISCHTINTILSLQLCFPQTLVTTKHKYDHILKWW